MKRLVVCADGTWNSKKDAFPTNVVTLSSVVKPVASDATAQVVYYGAGVGTGGLLDKWLGGAFGVGLGDHVLEAYRFLIDNYQTGDEIYLVGFSRGAFTVRSLAGLIRNSGILAKSNAARVDEAWRLYTKRDNSADTPEAIEFRGRYSVPGADVRFIGVWETVGALGIPGFFRFLTRRRVGFHDMRLSRTVPFAYQALAIDENRATFPAAVWHQHPQAPPAQVLGQRWFPGDHNDVGGGWATANLSNCVLRWLADKAIAAGLDIDADALRAVIAPYPEDALGLLHDPRVGIFKWMPVGHREIGVGGPDGGEGGPSNESLSDEARQRYEKMATYRPANLEAYLKAHPEALG